MLGGVEERRGLDLIGVDGWTWYGYSAVRRVEDPKGSLSFFFFSFLFFFC